MEIVSHRRAVCEVIREVHFEIIRPILEGNTMKIRVMLALLVLLASTAIAREKPVEKVKTQAKICDPAAKLKGLQWVKGGPVELKKDAIYVVEFWATWCPPCRVSIPHLTKLQKKFKDKKVTFVGISSESLDKVKPFVQDKGAAMDYVVAVDPGRKISDGYMMAYRQRGIPTAFIVDKQLRVVWVGHPMSDLDTVLEKVVAGKFDPKVYAAQKELERKKNAMATSAFREYFEALQKDVAKKVKTAAGVIIENGSSQLLNAFAWRVLTEVEQDKQDLSIALEAAAKANEMTEGKDAAILDTFALALFKNGEVARAIEVEKKALKLATGDDRMVAEFKARLDEFTKAPAGQ